MLTKLARLALLLLLTVALAGGAARVVRAQDAALPQAAEGEAPAETSAGAPEEAPVDDGELHVVPAPTLGKEAVEALAGDLREALPEPLTSSEWLGLEPWQWAILGLVILFGLLVDLMVRFTVVRLAHRLLRRWRAATSEEAESRHLRPVGVMAAAGAWLVLLPLTALDGLALDVLITAVRLVLALASVWAAWRFVDLLAEGAAFRASRTKTRMDDVLVPLLRTTAKIFVVAFGVIYLAHGLGVQIGPLLAGLGIGGLAFAFAAKDTIENFFGSVAVLTDQPFHVGDWVIVNGDVEGTVEQIGFRSTRIRTFYDSQLTLPNSVLVRATVDNMGRRRYRRIKTTFGLTYDTPPEKIEAFVEGLRRLIAEHPRGRKGGNQVWFKDFSASSLDILFYVFVEAPTWSDELEARQELLLGALRLGADLGVEFAFPTRTVHLPGPETPDAAPT